MTNKKNYFKTFLLLVLCIGGAKQVNAQVNLTNGLMAYYPFSGTCTDLSGNSNNGTPSGSAGYTADPWGNANSAAVFGGPNNPGRVYVPNSTSLQFSATASFAYWYKLNSTVGTDGLGNIVGGGSHCVFAKDADAGSGLYHNASVQPGNVLYGHIGNAGMTTNIFSIQNYNVGQWVHVVYVMDVNETRVYYNGALYSTQAGASTFTMMNTRPLVIGRYSSNWYPLDGAVDEFRVYNRVLNTAEIAALAGVLTTGVTGTINGPLCAGQALTVNFNVTAGTPVSGNNYVLQLSDANGSFAFPVVLGTMASTAMSGTFNVTLPEGIPSGTAYAVRVNATQPGSAGTATAPFTINGVLGDIPSAAQVRYCGSSGGRHYYMSLTQQTWAQALALCAANSCEMAYIPDAATNAILAPFGSLGSYFGYSDQATEGTWIWTGGGNSTYTNWLPNEPNNSGNEDYAHMEVNGKWNDANGIVPAYALMQLVPVNANITMCGGGNVNLTAAPLSGATYSWSGPNGFTSSLQNPVISNATSASSGTYSLTYIKNGCSATVTTGVAINPAAADVGQNSVLPSALTTGLVVYYPFDGNANDASGNGLNGTINGGVTPEADRFNNPNGALRMNGTNGYVQAAAATYFTGGDYTVAAWIKTAANGSWPRIMDFGNGMANNNVLLAYSAGTTGRPAAEVFNASTSGGQIASASVATPLNQWTHVALTWSAGTGRIYVNGVLAAQGNMTAPTNVMRTLCYIGRSNWAGDAYANAAFDEFRIYNRSLNSAEVSLLVLEQPGTVGLTSDVIGVCPSTAASVLVINSQPGVLYQLQDTTNNLNVGPAVSGNGDTLFLPTGVLTTATTFQVVATATGSGCLRVLSGIITIQVSQAPVPVITAIGSTTFCLGDSVQLQGSGGNSYLWNNGDTTASIFVTQSGSYYVTVSNFGCDAVSSVINVTVNQPPAVTCSMPQSVYCMADSPQPLTGGFPAGGTYSGAGVSGSTFTPAAAGTGPATIVYTYTDANGCSNTASVTVQVDVCSGVEEAGAATEPLLVFPNPATERVTLRWNSAAAELLVYDVTGRIISTVDVHNSRQYELDLTNYAVGVYYAVVKTGTETLRVPFVKK